MADYSENSMNHVNTRFGKSIGCLNFKAGCTYSIKYKIYFILFLPLYINITTYKLLSCYIIIVSLV
jgi:hypothetical protein